MRYRYTLTWSERFGAWVERTWLCRVRGRCLVKLGSRPYCYRCGRVPASRKAR